MVTKASEEYQALKAEHDKLYIQSSDLYQKDKRSKADYKRLEQLDNEIWAIINKMDELVPPVK